MNTATTQAGSTYKNGLNIHLVAFSLPKEVIKEKEEIRVSITAMPDEVKQHFTIKGKLMDYTNHLFSLNITNQTKKIIMVFRKKTSFLSENPIIASTTIQLKDFEEMPKEQITQGAINTDIRSVNLYYPLQKQMKEEHQKKVERIILGYMKIKLSFTTPFSKIQQDPVRPISKNNNQTCDQKEKKIHKKKNGKKVSEYKDFDENSNICESLLF